MPLLGCIADDFTGATDLANTLVSEGMRVAQVFGVPDKHLELSETDALIVALKSRSIPAEEAIAQSIDSLHWLQNKGAKRFLFKYCSTFDSTPAGNIGPVISALMKEIEVSHTIACPAFPDNGRTVYQGHLFVFDKLLSESGMETHPLNPMTDSNLVRWLQQQTEDLVDLLPLQTIEEGEDAIVAHHNQEREQSRISIVDTVRNEHLRRLGAALAKLPLLTGGSGIALGLPNAYRKAGLLPSERATATFPSIEGFEAVISGSCSPMTLQQVAYMKERFPSRQLGIGEVLDRSDLVDEVLAWADPLLEKGPVLVYSSADPVSVKKAQSRGGALDVGIRFEKVLAGIACGLVGKGVRKLIVAGGETAGAVVNALQIPAIRIGPQIDPGVPWVESIGQPSLALALKSGNFGHETFFEKALNLLK